MVKPTGSKLTRGDLYTLAILTVGLLTAVAVAFTWAAGVPW